MKLICFSNKETIYSFLLIQITFGTFYSSDNHVDIDPLYKDKAHIQSDLNEKVSTLLLKQVTVRESRRIRCLVQIPGDAEGKTSDSTSLVVLGENVFIISVVNIIDHFAAFLKLLCWFACGHKCIKKNTMFTTL